jgi:hypothetical protein
VTGDRRLVDAEEWGAAVVRVRAPRGEPALEGWVDDHERIYDEALARGHR